MPLATLVLPLQQLNDEYVSLFGENYMTGKSM